DEPSIDGQELHAKKIEILSVSSGNQQKISINVLGEFKYNRKIDGEPPEGFNTPPPPSGPPSGAGGLPSNLGATNEPNPNELEPEPEPEPTLGAGGFGLEPEIEEEPEVPE
ncbi:9490_t:CDS:1, partial [Funneliformis geosporum]